MPKPIEFHQGARDDFDESFNWYAKRSHDAAIGFANAVDDAILEVLANSNRFPMTFCGCRHTTLKRFPFRIVFRDIQDRLVIVAVAHAKRRPGYWRDRV